MATRSRFPDFQFSPKRCYPQGVDYQLSTCFSVEDDCNRPTVNGDDHDQFLDSSINQVHTASRQSSYMGKGDHGNDRSNGVILVSNSCNGSSPDSVDPECGHQQLESSQYSYIQPPALPRREQSLYERRQPMTSSGYQTKTHLSENSSISAPQLFLKHRINNLQRQPDALHSFHTRHYAKLCKYMEYVSSRMPLPAGVSCGPTEATRWRAASTVWLDSYSPQGSLEEDCRQSWSPSQQEAAPCRGQMSPEARLVLHFACNRRSAHCLYPGRSTMSCLEIVTKNAVTWMQLLVLSGHVRYGQPLASSHPLMQSLRQSWANLLISHLGAHEGSSLWFPTQDRLDESHGKSRPASMNLDSYTADSRTHGSIRSRARSWHSVRLRSSRKQLRKVNSFFLLATRAYPSIADLECLERELREQHVFEVFRSELAVDADKRLEHHWNCLYCTGRPPVPLQISRLPDISDLPHTGSLNPGSRTPLLPEYRPQHRGPLLVRHIPPGSCRLQHIWPARWQLQEFQLRDGVLEWRGLLPARRTRQHSPNDGPVRPTEAKDCCNCTSSNSVTDDGKKIRREQKVFRVPITSISSVRGVRHKSTGALQQLEVVTDSYGLWLMKAIEYRRPKAHRNSVCGSVVCRLTSPEPERQPATGNDQLAVWIQYLQIALAQANQLNEYGLVRGDTEP